jgi:hypothetical protein
MIGKSAFKKVIVAASLASVAACADSTLAPTGAAAPRVVRQSSSGKADTVVTQFTIDPKTSSNFNVGSSHSLHMPARTVCDPATSSYGVGTWEESCTPLRSRLVITAKTWTRADGSPAVDFSPSLRFMPSAKGDVVTLTMKLGAGASTSDLRFFYCASPTAPCFDESLTDSTLTVQVDAHRNTASRRIKHFSGYNVSSGRADSMDSSF